MLLSYCFSSQLMMLNGGHLDIAQLLASHFTNVASALLGEQHSWTRICCRLSARSDQMRSLPHKGYRSVTEILDDRLGPDSTISIAYKVHYICLVMQTKNRNKKVDPLTGLLDKCRQAHQGYCSSCLLIMYALLLTFYHQDNVTCAKVWATTLINRAKELERYDYQRRALHGLACLHYDADERAAAEMCMREAIALVNQHHRNSDRFLVKMLMTLQEWLLTWNREDEADQVKTEIDILIFCGSQLRYWLELPEQEDEEGIG